jgi:molybdopterin/thiamine biosynthesis adenylyltransferase
MTGERYARLEQIEGWDRQRVARARALVAGAGALGNELIKNLLLVGWGTIVVVDPDRIEESNLSRSVLFQAGDVGRPKAAAVAGSAARLNPDPAVIGLVGDLRAMVSAGMLSRVDAVFGCLDNIVARVALGQLAARAGRLFVDGGLTAWEGTVRLFLPPDGPCYGCGLTEEDLRDLTLRRSCLAYAARSQASGGVATTPTVASMTGALMAQQGLRWIHRGRHDQDIPVGRELRFDLAHDRFWNTSIPRNAECLLHENAVPLADAPVLSWERSWASALKSVRDELGWQDAEFRLPLQVLAGWTCLDCGATCDVPRAQAGDAPVGCTRCGQVAVPDLVNVMVGGEPWAELSPRQTGFPPWTWVEVRSGAGERAYELAGASAELSVLAREQP